ncbi:hypothetical protein D3C83_146010 [compost metagenome]
MAQCAWPRASEAKCCDTGTGGSSGPQHVVGDVKCPRVAAGGKAGAVDPRAVAKSVLFRQRGGSGGNRVKNGLPVLGSIRFEIF